MYIRALYVGQWTQRVTIARIKVIPVSGDRYFNRYPLIIVIINFIDSCLLQFVQFFFDDYSSRIIKRREPCNFYIYNNSTRIIIIVEIFNLRT